MPSSPAKVPTTVFITPPKRVQPFQILVASVLVGSPRRCGGIDAGSCAGVGVCGPVIPPSAGWAGPHRLCSVGKPVASPVVDDPTALTPTLSFDGSTRAPPSPLTGDDQSPVSAHYGPPR